VPAGGFTRRRRRAVRYFAARSAPGLLVAAALYPSTAATAATSEVATILSEQSAVVAQTFQGPVDEAQGAVQGARSAVDGDVSAWQHDLSQQQATISDVARTAATASSDRVALNSAASADRAAADRLDLDRTRLRGMALGLYTGNDGGLVPSGSAGLQLTQEQLYAQTEALIVATTVVADVHRDTIVAVAARLTHQRRATTYRTDLARLTADRQAESRNAAQVASDSSALSGAEAVLTSAQSRLGSVLAARSSAIASLAGPPSAAGGISVVGRSALDPQQLAGWFTSSGYFDITSAPIARLAARYVSMGSAEGVRGDVAFAQAVLETGGFSSPDAVDLNNYAGIGHCDSCAQGWQFPSPAYGVLGQLQLLRIFAAGGFPAGSPPPALPALTPANQSRSGCCATWESLTGVWATDPLYGSSILGIYDQMLSYALANPQPA
jgi:Mannosyl-glycoprotein endo-beta-N-acetylglucosaminidase